MSIVGITRVTCPGCGLAQDARLVQSINTHKNPADKQRLLRGELNVLVCACGRRTQLAANVVFHDPDADYFCQVAPGGEADVAKAAEAFRASGARGTQRIVPSLNALVEKVKLLDAGLEDWAIEMAKVLLLAASPEPDLDRVLLFEALDGEVIRWVLFASELRPMASPRSAYAKLASRTHARPAAGEAQIDRAWAVEAVRQMIANAS